VTRPRPPPFLRSRRRSWQRALQPASSSAMRVPNSAGDRKSNRSAAGVSGNLASREGALQGHSASRRGATRGDAGSQPLFGRAQGGLAAWLGAACREHAHSGRREWLVSCATRRRKTTTTAPAGESPTRAVVGLDVPVGYGLNGRVFPSGRLAGRADPRRHIRNWAGSPMRVRVRRTGGGFDSNNPPATPVAFGS
jgi:hypothetical protein